MFSVNLTFLLEIFKTQFTPLLGILSWDFRFDDGEDLLGSTMAMGLTMAKIHWVQ